MSILRYTTSAQRRHAFRASLALLLALILFMATTARVSAAPASAEFTGYGPGYSDVYLADDAGSFNFSVEGNSVVAYCVQQTKSFSGTSTTYTTASLGSQGIPGDGTAAWIALNHASTGTPLADTASEHAATQVAIWVYTNGAVINETNVESPSIRDRATELAAAAAGHSVSSRASSFNLSLDMTVDPSSSEAMFTATASADDGTPFSGIDVAFAFPDESYNITLSTGGDGTVSVPYPVPSEGGTVSGDASAQFRVPAGSLLVPADGTQVQVTASSTSVTRTASASTDVAPPATTTTVPATTTTAAPGEPTTTTTAPVTTTVPATSTTVASVPTTTPPTTTPSSPPTSAVSSIDELPYTGGAFPMALLIGVIAAALLGLLAYRRSRQVGD